MISAVASSDEDELGEWLRSRGGRIRVAIASQGGLRGLIATQDSEVGEALLDVPLGSVLCDAHPEEPTASSLPGSAPAWARPLPPKVQLALHFLALQAEGRASDWAPLVRSWPAEPPLLASDLPPDALRAAQGHTQRTTHAVHLPSVHS